MLQKNNIVNGAVLASIFPGITWLVLGVILNNKVVFFDKPAIPYLIAVAINLFLIRYLFKKRQDQTATGVILVTFMIMLFAFLVQINYLL
jgi:hypothetical protein